MCGPFLLAKLYTVFWLHELANITQSQKNSSILLTINEVASLKSIRSSGLPIGGDVDPLVSKHVHAGS